MTSEKTVLRDFEKYEVDPYRRDEQFAEWEQRIKEDEDAIKQSDIKLGEYDKAKETLAGQIAVAEGVKQVLCRPRRTAAGAGSA